MSTEYINESKAQSLQAILEKLADFQPATISEYTSTIQLEIEAKQSSGNTKVFLEASGSFVDANEVSKEIKSLANRIVTDESLKNSFINWAVSESSAKDELDVDAAGVVYTTFFKDNPGWFSADFSIEELSEVSDNTAGAGAGGFFLDTLAEVVTLGGFDSATYNDDSVVIPANIKIAEYYTPAADDMSLRLVDKRLVPFWADGNGEKLLQEFENAYNIDSQIAAAEGAGLGEEALAAKKKEIYAQGVATAARSKDFENNLPAEIQEQKVNWWQKHKQCILLAGLDKLYPINENIRKSLKANKYHPYRGRIIPINSSNPETLMNDMMIPPFTNAYLGPAMLKDWYTWVKPTYKISYIQSVDGGFMEKKVFPILSNQKSYDSCADKPTAEMNILKGSKFDAASNIIFESFSYSMNGGDPATARKDISAQLKIKLTNLEYINKPFEVPAIDNEGKARTKTMKIVDLLLYPSDIQNSKGPGRVYTNQYHPSYNRLQVSITNRIVNEDLALSSLVQTKKLDKAKKHLELLKTIFKEGAMILNLALVDHAFSINKTKDDFSISLTIDYAGYFETALGAPYVDGLAGEELIEKRQNREDELVQLVKEGKCSVTDIGKIMGNFERQAQAEAKKARQDIMNRMIRRKKIHKVVFDQTAIRDYALTSTTTPNDPVKLWQAADIGDLPVGINQDQLNEDQVQAQSADIQASTTKAPEKMADLKNIKTSSQENLYFFFLGDLLEVVSDCMFENTNEFFTKSRDANSKTLEKMKLYLATSNFTYKTQEEKQKDQNAPSGPSQGSVSEKVHNINICDVPISVDFFKSWFNETVIKKRRTYYPAMAMIRDLVERVITNLLNEVCFNGGGDAGKVLFKVTTGSTLMEGDSDYMYKKYINSGGANLDLDNLNGSELPLLRRDVDRPAKDYTNYLIIYTQEQSMYDSTIGTRGQHKLHLSKNIPHLIVGHNQDGSVISANFTKTDVPFHREARYFQGGGGSLMQLANVYQAKGVELEHNTFMHNGMMVWMEFVDLNNCGGTSASPGSLANQLGLGGYHIVTNTQGTVKPNSTGDTKIDASWVFSGVRRSIRPTTDVPGSITSEESCSDLVSDSAREADDMEQSAQQQIQEEEKITQEENPAVEAFGEGEQQTVGGAILSVFTSPTST